MPSTATRAAIAMAIPSTDSADRTCRARSPSPPRASASTALTRERLRSPEIGIRSSGSLRCAVVDDVPVAQLDLSAHRCGDGRVVGDDQHGGGRVGESGEEGDDVGAGGRVEVAGGFIGQHEGGVSGDGAGDGGALAFTAGELAGSVGESLAEPDFVEGGGARRSALAGVSPR